MRKDDLFGKYLLVGVTFLDAEENVIEQYQTHGTIISVDDRTGVVIEKSDGSGRYTVPADTGGIHPAPPGDYQIRTTGEVVVDPDFMSTWTVFETMGSTIENYKKSGFTDLS